MADQSKADMVMKFIQKGGTPVSAECALDKDPNDPFMKDFHPAPYQDYSDFFEIQSFDFGMEVKDDDTAVGALTKNSQGQGPPSKGGTPAKAKGGFVSWRSAKTDELKNLDYPIEFDTFSFKRLIDAASPIFFEACCGTKTFDSATLVKRVSIGMLGGGGNFLNAQVNLGPLHLSLTGSSGINRPPQGFLRIDFTNVLIIGIDWDDGDVLNETCKFICQGFKLQYRQQNDDGSLKTAVAPAEWDYKKDARRTNGAR